MLKNILQLKKTNFRFLILGSEGLLGTEFKKLIKKKYRLCISRKYSDVNMDLTNFKLLKKIFTLLKFDYVINCAAMTSISECEKKIHKANLINYFLPKKLDIYSKKYNFKLVHISTDHFFRRKSFKLNTERSKIFALNNYSLTKLKAERSILNKNNLIIRTNFTGFKKRNFTSTFVGWLYSSIKKKKKIKLFHDMYVSTIDVSTCSKIVKKLIDLNASGVFNVGTSDYVSKKEFAIMFSKKLKKPFFFNSISVNELAINRGKYLALDVSKVQKKLGIKMITIKKTINNLAKISFKNKL